MTERMRLALIPVKQIHPNPRNPRSDLGSVAELALSIRAEGILEPLIVEPVHEGAGREGSYLLQAGHRRLKAAKWVGLEAVPCIVRVAVGARQQTARALIENLHREPLPPLDEARAYKLLLAEGMTRQQVALAVGVSAATVAARLQLLDLPADAQQMVQAATLPLTLAADLGRQLRRSRSGWVSSEKCPRHFTSRHPLALDAQHRCNEAGHPLAGRLNKTACGACWEAEIREDVLAGDDVPDDAAPGGLVDEVAVQRAVGGDLSVALSVLERREAVRLLHRQRLSDGQIAQVLGLSDRTVLRIRQRLDLPAVC